VQVVLLSVALIESSRNRFEQNVALLKLDAVRCYFTLYEEAHEFQSGSKDSFSVNIVFLNY
jgi:hypothetical protein